ncbi:MAG: SDR family NAD(P)-dependent oxidoreductase [Salibacteraceae bacterium]
MNIIVTGASRGIGAELARYFVAQGHQVLGVSRNGDAMETIRAELNAASGEGVFHCLAVDLTRDSALEAVSAFIKSEWGRVDRSVNNAGMLLHQPFGATNDAQVQKMFEVNLLAPGRLIRRILPYLQEVKKGHVVNIGSMGGYQGSAKFPGLAYYSASKAALASLTECLAEEYREQGISFNCLALGAVQTDMLAEAFPGYEAPLGAAAMAKHIGHFVLEGHEVYNGKVLPVSLSSP